MAEGLGELEHEGAHVDAEFGLFEGGLDVDFLVALGDEFIDSLEGVVVGFPEGGHVEDIGGGGWDFSVAVFADHGRDTGGEVADAVDELGAVVFLEEFDGEVAVGIGREGAEEVVADGVGAVVEDKVVGIYDIAEAFGHLLTFGGDEAVDENLFGQGQTSRQEHPLPHRALLAEVVFAGDLDAWPSGLEGFFIVRPAEGADVVYEGVEPHVHDLVGVAWNFNPPWHLGSETGDTEILKSTGDKAFDFLETAVGYHKIGMTRIVVEQGLLIVGPAEEIIFFFDDFYIAVWVDGAAAVDEFRVGFF